MAAGGGSKGRTANLLNLRCEMGVEGMEGMEGMFQA
jgi:hypothetical protein